MGKAANVSKTVKWFSQYVVWTYVTSRVMSIKCDSHSTCCLESIQGSLPTKECNPGFFTSMRGPPRSDLCAFSATYHLPLPCPLSALCSPLHTLHCAPPLVPFVHVATFVERLMISGFILQETLPPHKFFLYSFYQYLAVFSILISEWRIICLPSKNNSQITTPLSFSIYLFGEHLLSACCLLYWN